MNRAMFSGVAGMKAHQTKMDVIGNNIANVNTYGYKSQRAVFSDIYYQTLRGASGGSSSRGGINPSSVGYGSTLSAVQTQMSQSSMQNTGFGMDVAITGEGFLQVMDPDGNIFYTKAGMLDYDANGYLTDINGNFVLGATDVDGRPGTQKIKLDNIGSVDARQPSDTQLINGVNFTVTASNASKYGNASFNLSASAALPAGQKAAATISATGGISVQLNAKETFTSLAELNSEINAAIIEANGGKQMAAGTFTITADKNLFGTAGMAAGFQGAGQTYKPGITTGDRFFDGLEIASSSMSKKPSADGAIPFSIQYAPPAGGADGKYTMQATVEGVTYTAEFDGNVTGNITLNAPAGTDAGGNSYPAGFITVSIADSNAFKTNVLAAASVGRDETTPNPDGTTSTITVYDPVSSDAECWGPHYFLGGGKISAVSSNLSQGGAMEFNCTITADGKYKITAEVNGVSYTGTVDVAAGGTAELTVEGFDKNLYGSISVFMPPLATVAANLGLPSTTTAADAALKAAVGDSVKYHSYKTIAAKNGVSAPLTGAQIAGGNFGITGGSITGSGANNMFNGLMSFQKTSSGFTGSGAGIDENGLVAEFKEDAGHKPFWEISLNVGGKKYTAQIAEDTTAASILLKAGDDDYIQMSNPTFQSLSQLYNDRKASPTDPDAGVGSVLKGLTNGQTLDVTAAQPSLDLGLGTTSFALVGGTEGGAITLDQLSTISIGSDGTITVNHAEKGTVAAGKISLATFSNPSGLQLVGNNYYITTANSGDAKLSDPGSGGTGALKSSALEMSNVDLSAEFADMITTQRGFQANSRIITVSDTMLEELINLKR